MVSVLNGITLLRGRFPIYNSLTPFSVQPNNSNGEWITDSRAESDRADWNKWTGMNRNTTWVSGTWNYLIRHALETEFFFCVNLYFCFLIIIILNGNKNSISFAVICRFLKNLVWVFNFRILLGTSRYWYLLYIPLRKGNSHIEVL